MSNHKFLKQIYPDFQTWEKENSILWNDFNEFCNYFEEFILSRILTDVKISNKIIELVPSVIHKCNELDFDQPYIVEAYSIMHLLDRYHRFQLIYQILIREGLLPLRRKSSDILEVGTGPANALFALEDTYCLLKKYGKEKNIDNLQTFEFSLDYAEKSNNFRKLLHYFTEFIYEKRKFQTHIPYHHGSFSDFFSLNLQKEKSQLHQDLIINYAEECDCSRSFAQSMIDREDSGWKDAFRYNMVVFSNFLTEKEQVMKSKEQIKSICCALRNGGIILIVGARGKDYPGIYESIRNEIENFRFMKLQYNSNVNEMLCKYSFNDTFGQRIDIFYDNLITHLDNLGMKSNSYSSFKEKIKEPKKPRAEIKWEIIVFRKQLSHYKNFKKLKG